MRSDPVLGELTETDRRREQAAVDAAGHAWDTRAAALSNGSGGDAGRLSDVIRGGPARPGERNSATGSGIPNGMLGYDSARWHEILAELTSGRIKELVFVEFGPDCVSVIRASADANGIPRQADAGSTEWRSVAPLLDRRPEIRRFQLAGGIGTLPPVGRTDFDEAVAHWLKAFVPPSSAHTMVLLCRRGGWVLLDRAANLLRAAYPLLAEAAPATRTATATATTPARNRPAHGPDETPVEDAIAELLRTAPLLLDHTLLLADVDDRTGAVRTHTEVLFPAGSRLPAGTTATAEVTVHGGIEHGAPALLPVLAGRPGSDGSGATVLSAPGSDLAALGTARLTFELHGPGDVRLAGSAALPGSGHDLPDLPDLVRRLPRRIVRPPGLEVWFTVEMSGADAAETAERLAFVREVVSALAERDGPGGRLRVGVVGHYDHVIHENGHTARPTLLLPLASATAGHVLTELARWQPAPRRQDMTSSLEDALRAVARRAAAPARGGQDTRRTLLVVGRRPPAVSVLRGPVPSCPLGADWRLELQALRGHGIRVLARADPVPPGPPGTPDPAGDYARSAWAALSAEGSFQPGTDAPAAVAEALTPVWRSDGPSCPLAFATALR
ncbi:hypothetical protein [Streptomyces sp. CA-111067]|uniref:hypothetical protein n=1 Tax=Streptomyces sp. CA-111067 TaxID=3240046 RepID=UPI003D996721